MLCRLYGRPDCSTFNGSWATIMEYVTTQGTRFNWAGILMTSMQTNLNSALAPEEGMPAEFYMASYLLDAVCARVEFDGWEHNWDPENTRAIHLQLKVFWESKYKQDIDRITQIFVPALYRHLFGQDAPCMSWRAKETLVKVAHWFPFPEYTFIRVFGTYKAPHVMPRFVTDKMLMQEVCFQMSHGFSNILSKGKKKPWPTLPLTIGAFTIKDFKEVLAEADAMRSYQLRAIEHRNYDPERLVPEHCRRANLRWTYQHLERPAEDERRNWYNAERQLAPGVDVVQEDSDDQNLEDRRRQLGASSSSMLLKSRINTGSTPSAKQKEAEAKAQQEREKKLKEDEEARQKSTTAAQKKKLTKEARKEKEDKEAQAAAEQALKAELDKAEAERQKKAEQAAAAEQKKRAEIEAAAEAERQRKAEQAAAAEQKRKAEIAAAEAERRRKEEEEKNTEEREDDTLDDLEVTPLDVPLGRTQLSDVRSPQRQEEDVFDLTRLTFDQFSFKIRQEKRRSLALSPSASSAVSTGKDIVLDTRTNPVMIASAGTAFAAATEENVTRMSREIVALQNRLHAAEQREKMAEQERAALQAEVQQLRNQALPANEVSLAIFKECEVLEMTMRQVYGEMFTIKQTVAPLARARMETRQRQDQLKEASQALDRMMGWTIQYPQAPENLPKRDWIHTQDAKVQLRMAMQSGDKLSKDLDKVMSSYDHLISGIDSMHTLHHIPSLGALEEEKTWEQVNQDIQIFLQPIKQAAADPEPSASQEHLSQFIAAPARIYTKLASLSNQIGQKRETLVPNALECVHRLKEEVPLVSPIAAEYQAWQDFLREQQVDIPDINSSRPGSSKS